MKDETLVELAEPVLHDITRKLFHSIPSILANIEAKKGKKPQAHSKLLFSSNFFF